MQKLFYRTYIGDNDYSFNDFNPTNLEDISYMFAFTPIEIFKRAAIFTFILLLCLLIYMIKMVRS